MIRVLAFLVLSSICVIINAQETASNEKRKFKDKKCINFTILKDFCYIQLYANKSNWI